MWVVPLSHLTEDQLSAVQLSSAKHRVIVGGPGSGKTLVLAHRAQRLLAAGAAPDGVRVFVFTNVLASYLKEGLAELGLPPGTVSTFDSWCLGLFDSLVGGPRPTAWSGGRAVGIDFEAMRLAVLAKVEVTRPAPVLEVALVDEGQDLSESAIRLIAAASKHVTLAMDARQQLYSTGMDIQTACDLLGVQRASSSLLTAYRCTPLIVDLAAEFLPTDEESAIFRAANLLPLDGVETPVLFTAEDPKAEMDELAALLGERAMLGHASAVLVPNRAAERRIVKELSDRLVQVSTRDDLTFGDLRPIVMTYHSAKGLTVDAVLMPDLTEKAFARVTESAQRERMLFVGITRATRWAWLGTRRDGSLAEIDRLQKLGRRKSLRMLPDEHFASALSTTAPQPRVAVPAKTAAPARKAVPAKKAAPAKAGVPVKKAARPALNIADLL
jgi:superfamily I DNA/RNA helicase